MTALASGFSNTATNGSLLAAAGVALVAGVIGFLSPCVLPLVPGYLSYVAGLSGQATRSSGGAGHRAATGRMICGAVLFVLGFSAIFIAGGALFGSLGSYIAEYRLDLERMFGVVTIVMGIAFLGRGALLQREFKIHALPRAGLFGAPLLGLTFGLAWSPCITPTLSAVLGAATQQATAVRGALLSAAYCAGLGVPFVLVAMGIGWVSGALAFVRRHAGVISRVGGLVLIVMGLLLVSGLWDHYMNVLQVKFSRVGVGADI
jgi:cytochrome c-type biogenesis protein